MSQESFKDGVKAARAGREACPPKYGTFGGPIGEICLGVTEKMLKSSAQDYMVGYRGGSQQHLADTIKKGDKK
ncbi:MAG: hypothetical protein WCQ21_13595 [Verrucomicrobiota bacterium]